MQEDFFPAAEKILSDIESIFKKDTNLRTFEVFPVLKNENKSPVHYQDHCLGLESWCVPHVYCHAYKNLISLRQSKGVARDIDKCNTLLIGALLLNPEITTFWNMRKEHINCGRLDPYFDLHFTSVILSYKPKSADVYAYRKWILKKIMNDFSLNQNNLINELEICDAAADRYSNNYHAWTHRVWCLSQSLPGIFQREWMSSLKWIHRHVSDYSGFHYRQKLISQLLTFIQNASYDQEYIKIIIFNVEEATEEFIRISGSTNSAQLKEILPLSLKLLIFELVLNTDLIKNFIGHEALWCHRRFIFHKLKSLIFLSNEINDSWGYFDISNHSNSDGVPVQKNLKIEIKAILDNFSFMLTFFESSFLDKCFSEPESQQTTYAKKHKFWLSKFNKFLLPFNKSDKEIFTLRT